MSKLTKVKLVAKQRFRGVLSPAVLQLRQQTFDVKDAIVISGFFRSGTTWLAELIAKSVNGGVIFEPFHTDHVAAASEAGFSYNNFRVPDEQWSNGKQYVNEILRGKRLNTWSAAHIPVSQACRMHRLVVKLVSTNQMLVWLERNTDIPTPILLIRHPCAVLSSWVNRGWRLNSWVVTGPELLAEYPEIENLVAPLKNDEEFFAARWCIDHYVPFMQRQNNEFVVVAFEKLVSGGAPYLDGVLSNWGENLPESVRNDMRRPSEKASQQIVADYNSVSSGWRKSLTKKQIDSVLRVVDSFGLGFYSYDVEPDYDRLFGPQPINRM